MEEEKKFVEEMPVVSDDQEAAIVLEQESEAPIAEEIPAKPKKKNKKPRKKIYDYTLEKDIKYRGPLSYRHLRMFGWFFLAVSQIAVILTLGGKVDPYIKTTSEGWIAALQYIGSIMMPLFLLANFSFILRAHNNYRSLLIKYIGMAVGFAALYLILYEHYVVGFFATFTGSAASARTVLDEMLESFFGTGNKAINVFMDLLLCTLLFFFLNYRPTKFFQGKNIIWFRLFAIFPILYEAASVIIKLLVGRFVINLSPYLFPFLTCKPPLSFLAFVAIAIFFTIRKSVFLKHGKTSKQYDEFLKTNANSWQVSKIVTIIFVIASIIDFLVFFGILFAGIIRGIKAGGGDEDVVAISMLVALNDAQSLGIGGAAALIFVVPFALLFSYTKIHKDNKLDLIIPLAGIGLVVFVYLEGIFQLTRRIPDMIQRIIDQYMNPPEA